MVAAMTLVLGTKMTVTLAAMTCPIVGCGVTYGLDEEIKRRRLQDHGNWYCTNGHILHYPQKSDVEIAQEERDAARSLAQREAQRRQKAESSARTLEYQRRAAVGQTTKLRKRVSNGVCPCCNRTFADLARHMAGKHPDFAPGSSS